MEHSAAAVSAAATTTTPKKTHLNLDTLSNKSSSSYTSLRDVLPFPAAAVNSPTPSAAASSSGGGSISIRNRLVKQAAWAYLQPMSPSPCGPSGPNFIGCLRLRFESESRRRNGDIGCRSFLSDIVACFNRVFQHIFHAITRQGIR